MPEYEDRRYDFPVEIDNDHRVTESLFHTGDKFECDVYDAFSHSGAWPTWNVCPWCRGDIDV